jgi:hypothetical protein
MSADPMIDDFRTLVLERLKVAVRHDIARPVLEQADVRVISDVFSDRLAVQLSSYVLADKLAPATHTVTFQRPARLHGNTSSSNGSRPSRGGYAARRVWLPRGSPST